VGGGVRGCAQAEALLRAGADRVAVNSAAVERPALLGELPNRDQIPAGERRCELLEGFPVGAEVGRNQHRIRAQAPRTRGRHRGVDSELPRFVAGGGHDGTRPAAGNNHGQAGELRAALQLHGRVEGIDVEVGDQTARHLLDAREGSRRVCSVAPEG